MAQYRINVAGVNIGLLDTADAASKDPGANTTPQAAPNSKNAQLNFNCTAPSGNILAVIANPG